MTRIKRIGVYQTAKVAAVIYFIFSAVIVVPIYLLASVFSNMGGAGNSAFPFIGGFFVVFIPFIYAIAAFIFTAIGCWIYNLISRSIGGIEVELESDNSELV